MSSAKLPADVDELLARMRSVRASGYDHVGDLQSEAKRLVDWKEYVRSKPLMSVAVASIIGFGLARSTFKSVSEPTVPPPSSSKVVEASSQLLTGWKSKAFALVSTVATSALKHYFSTLVQRAKSNGDFHDRFRDASSKEEITGSNR